MKIVKTLDDGTKIYRHNGVNFRLNADWPSLLLDDATSLRLLADDIELIEKMFWSNEHEDWQGVADDITEYAQNVAADLNILVLSEEDEQ